MRSGSDIIWGSCSLYLICHHRRPEDNAWGQAISWNVIARQLQAALNVQRVLAVEEMDQLDLTDPGPGPIYDPLLDALRQRLTSLPSLE